jgi:hypothetical protein
MSSPAPVSASPPGFLRRTVGRSFRILRTVCTVLGTLLLLLLMLCFTLGMTIGRMSFTEVANRLYESSPAQVVEGLSLATGLAGNKPKPSDPPVPAETRDGRWQQDIDYLMHNIAKLHAIPWRYISREAWEAKARLLRDSVSTKTDTQITCELSALLALLGDGHTRISRQESKVPYELLPIAVRSLAGGYFITQATKDQQRLVGAEIVAINDQAIGTVIAKTRGWVSAENHQADRANSEALIRQLDFLKAIGVCTQDEARFKLKLTSGIVEEITLTVPQKLDWADPGYPQAEYRNNRNAVACYRFDPHSALAIFQYNSCRERDLFRTIAAAFWTEFDQAERKALVVDLRGNGGGDSSIIKPLLEGIVARGLNSPGRLYVLTDRDTYSSAFHGLLELRKRNAIHLGEASAQKLNYGGNIEGFRLPNSQLRVSYPTQDSTWLPGIDVRSVEPDSAIDPTSKDYFHEVDPVLEEVKRRVGEHR